jgi:hypothetical protein
VTGGIEHLENMQPTCQKRTTQAAYRRAQSCGEKEHWQMRLLTATLLLLLLMTMMMAKVTAMPLPCRTNTRKKPALALHAAAAPAETAFRQSG